MYKLKNPKIEKIYHGPNIYENKPIILLSLSLDNVLVDQLLQSFKKIEKTFSDYIDDFITKIDNPYLYIGNSIVNFSLNLINNINGQLTVFGAKQENQKILFWIEFDIFNVTLESIKVVYNILVLTFSNADLKGKQIRKLLSDFNHFAKANQKYNEYLLSESKKQDLPSFQFSKGSVYRQYGWGNRSRVFRGFSPMEDSYHGVSESLDKLKSKTMLRSMGMPVANDVIIFTPKQLKEAASIIGYPCVVKPIKGSKGTGITANIKNFQELQNAYDKAKQSKFGNNPIMIESHIEGIDHRIVVINGKFQGAYQRIPTYITGDGNSTIRDIIAQLNVQREKPVEGQDFLYKQISINTVLLEHLSTLGLKPDDILELNQTIPLNSISNYSGGGECKNIEETVHPQVVQMAEIIAQVSQIKVLGIDYITKDISKPFTKGYGAVTEYNHQISFADLAFIGSSYNPFENCGRIPIGLTIVKNVDIPYITEWLKENIIDSKIGWHCNQEVYIGSLPLNIYDTSGWNSIKVLLRQQALEKAIVITTSIELMEKGLPVDRFASVSIDEQVELTEDWEKVLKRSTSKLLKYNSLTSLEEIHNL